MMLEPDSIGDAQVLAGLLQRFGIALARLPALPVSFPALVKFLKTEGVAGDAVQALIRHINRNVEIFRPGDRQRLSAHVWPDRALYPQRRLAEEMFWSERAPVVTRSSRIVTLGSAYAVELAKWLQLNGYNYLVKEPNLLAGQSVHASSARWGEIANAAAFRQIVEWAFGIAPPPRLIFRKQRIFDVFREDVTYSEEDLPRLDALWQEHASCARAALEEADVIVLMLETSEVYRYLPTGHFLPRAPRINPALWEPKLLGVDDTVAMLKSAIGHLRSFNPRVELIVGVSPDPLYLTFRRDVHVAAASAESKAVLRVALGQLCNDDPAVHYLASLETVMYPGDSLAAWDKDERRGSAAAFSKVTALFRQQFCSAEDGLQATRDLVPAVPSSANPYFETDHRIIRQALARCVEDGLADAARALDALNQCTPALYRNEFNSHGYALLRRLSFDSRLTFNLLCREMYRQAFPTHFARTDQSDAIARALSAQGCHVIAPTPESRRFASEMLAAMAAMPATREVDKKPGLFADLHAEGVPRAFRFFVDEGALPVAPAVKLLDDLGVLRAMGEELGHPILRNVHAWYSVRPSNLADGDIDGTAHQYHADNDTPTGWIKVFIYLTDVTEENGPHVFAPRSHRERPPELTRDGRFGDAEVERHFGPGLTMAGPAGTVIVENTQGLHKALTVRSGMRAIYQLECVNCLLGSRNDRHPRADALLADLASYDPRFVLRYAVDAARRPAV